MSAIWAQGVPNLLIGLREGLEAGLIVSILVATVRKIDPQRSLRPVWVGVVAAAMLSLSFGFILTFTDASLSSSAQAAFAGLLSVAAVALVTVMIFWMQRNARGLSGELRGKVNSALMVGGTSLVLTTVVAVGREGLETSLFVWTNTQAAGSDAAPLIGAALGLALAVAICVAMYRRILLLDIGRFFTYTGAFLVVIAAGVLAYGVGDLQEAGILGGGSNKAFDFTDSIPTDAWWLQLVRAVTNLNAVMSWAQVIAYVSYLAIVMTLFLRGTVRRPAVAAATVAGATVAERAVTTGAAPEAVDADPQRRRNVLVWAAAIVVPVLLALVAVPLLSRGTASASVAAVSLSETACAEGWVAPPAGPAVFGVDNVSGHAVDVELRRATDSAVVGEIEVLGPGTSRNLPVTLEPGSYAWRCVYDGLPTLQSATLQVSGTASSSGAAPAVIPVTTADMTGPVAAYRRYVARQLALLKTQTQALQRDLASGDVVAAKAAWLTAHMTYHRIGAAYDAFGDAGTAVDGLPEGLPAGISDPAFTGFHKVELILWSGATAQAALPAAAQLAKDVAALDAKMPTFTFDPNDISLRTHEILEGTMRFGLTGQDDFGSATSLATATADVEGTRTLLTVLAPLLQSRAPGLVATANAQLTTLQRAIDATRTGGAWIAVKDLTLAPRQRVNGAAGQVLETLSRVPDLLEIRA